jgi:hypothetical protein
MNLDAEGISNSNIVSFKFTQHVAQSKEHFSPWHNGGHVVGEELHQNWQNCSQDGWISHPANKSASTKTLLC